MAVENGMLVGAERYDMQYWEDEIVQCSFCGKRVRISECVKSFDDELVCEDCIADYLEDGNEEFIY